MILLSTKVYCQDKTETLFKIVAIKERNSYYIIHAKRNDSLFKIISRKIDNSDNSQKTIIKRGKYYLFEFGNKNDKNHPKHLNYMDIYSVQVSENDFIRLTKRFHYKIYETSNLKGLYYSAEKDKCVPPFLREYISKELKQYIIPTTEDYVAGWKSFLENKTLPFLACGDFNGDNKFDYAMILIHKGFDKSELFVFNATDYGYLYFKLEEYDVFNKKIATVISIEKKGTWESVNETITVTNDGLLVELIEEGLGWSFYWDGQQYNKFLYD